MITGLCNVYPLTPHFYIVKLGVYRGIHYFLIFAQKHIMWVLVRTAYNICFEQKYEKSKTNQLKIVIFTAVKNRCMLHGPVFVMCCLVSMSVSVLSNLFSLRLKLTRNKNARHIFPHHFFPVAMVGIICLYMHSLLYTFHTRSMFFKYLHYIRSYDHHCTKCTCTSFAPTTRLSIQKIVFDIVSFIY